MTHPGWGDGWTTEQLATRAEDDASGGPPTAVRRGRRRRVVRLVVVAAAVLLVVVVGLGVWLASDASRAAAELTDARDDVADLQDAVRAGDQAAADAALDGLQAHAAEARAATDGPLWRLAVHVPVVGPNTDAVQTVATTVDDLARLALPSLMAATALVDAESLAPRDGRIDTAPLRAAAPDIVAADHAVQAAAQRLEAVHVDDLAGVVAEPFVALRDEVDAVATTTATAAKAAVLLPAMLGEDGPRDYLVLVQNNAEQRATGGIAGSVMLLHAEDGRVTVTDERAGGGLSGLAEPVLPLDGAEQALYGPLLGTDMRDVNLTPDFPRSAALAKGIWEELVGGEVDGVLSVDPVALSLVLRATGPVALDDGSALAADDAVQRLLNGVYLEVPDPADQDAYFSGAASTVLQALVGGQGEPGAVVDALAEGARQGRLMVWSADPDEQAQLAGTVLAGELRGEQDGTSGVVGVYLNDRTQAKLGYYLDAAVSGAATTCHADGSQDVDLTLTFTSTAPPDAATLPPYLVGLDGVVPAGQIATNVMVYAPLGGGLEDVRVDGEASGVYAQVHDGLPVGALTVTLEPGETRRVEMRVSTGAGHSGDIRIRSTPMAEMSQFVPIASACTGARVA